MTEVFHLVNDNWIAKVLEANDRFIVTRQKSYSSETPTVLIAEYWKDGNEDFAREAAIEEARTCARVA